MIDLLGTFAGAFLVGLSGAMVPGPLFTVMLAEVGKKGFHASPLVSAGHATLEALMVSALAVGFGSVLAEPRVTGGIALFGTGFLLWMAVAMIQEVRSGNARLETATAEDLLEGGTRPQPLRPLLLGIGATLANPYWFLWWATVGAGSVALASELGQAGIVAFYLGHISADFGWLGVVAFGMVTGRRFLSDRVYAMILAVLALFLVVLAVYFAVSGIRLLTTSAQ